MREELKEVASPERLKLDLGCGKNAREGFVGVDCRDFGQDITTDLRQQWPWNDASVEEVHASHFVEHLTAPERIHFANELHRVLIPGGKATIITPYWASCRAYGDLTHQWPPVSEMWFLYLNKAWREAQAPHNDGYTCDFDHVCVPFSLHPALGARNPEYQQHAATFFKEAVLDLVATLTKRA
jgi:hypothetical protein